MSRLLKYTKENTDILPFDLAKSIVNIIESGEDKIVNYESHNESKTIIICCEKYVFNVGRPNGEVCTTIIISSDESSLNVTLYVAGAIHGHLFKKNALVKQLDQKFKSLGFNLNNVSDSVWEL